MMNNENKTVNAPTTSSSILEERHDSELFCVYALILDGITNHVLLLGKKLTESELCRQMTCSRNTVRSALSLLVHDKVVDLQSNRSTFVHVSDLEEMQNVFNARIEMKDMILGMLVDLPDLETHLRPFYAMVEHKEAASGSGDRVSWNHLSNAFRVELARLLDNDILFDIMNMLCARSSLIVTVFGAERREKHPIGTHTHAEHREILDLLVSGKRSRVVKVMRRYLGACIERLEQGFEAQ